MVLCSLQLIIDRTLWLTQTILINFFHYYIILEKNVEEDCINVLKEVPYVHQGCIYLIKNSNICE